MKTNIKILFLALLLGMSFQTYSQQTDIKLNPEKVKKFTTFIENRHGGPEKFQEWKNTNKLLYAQEMWYFSESFYVKRNHFAEGETMDESMFDIRRFENLRKQSEEFIIERPGFKDVIVLLPADKLIYKLP